jgi:serine O-acetyltransferase
VVVKEVPPGRTAIGIPARLVGGRTKVWYGGQLGIAIDLDHHLISDPVGKAIECLLERIETLESEVRSCQYATRTGGQLPTCIACAAGDLCCQEHGRG